MTGSVGFLENENASEARDFLRDVLDLCLDFKLRHRVGGVSSEAELRLRYLRELPTEGTNLQVIREMIRDLLNESMNFASPHFVGFPDAGNSVAALAGAIVEGLAQQNLLNASFCSRVGSIVEIATVQWLRELIGYPNVAAPTSAMDIGGVATPGGTISNLYGVLMGRRRADPESFKKGIASAAALRVLVPDRITHYSVRGAAGLIGMGTDSLIPVPTSGFRYDLKALASALKECSRRREKAACVVLNAGDSRTLTLDPIREVVNVVRDLSSDSWIHVDACHGGQLLFTDAGREALRGIDEVDSVALDPHKILNVPYTLSYFLFRDTTESVGFWSSSPLITADPFSLGQITPGVGSKSWMSIKLFLLLQHLGVNGIAAEVERRAEAARIFRAELERVELFRCLTPSSDINAVPFVYVGPQGRHLAPADISQLNQALYHRILSDGLTYLHGFRLYDDWNVLGGGRDTEYFVLRFMSGNPSTSKKEIRQVVEYVTELGESLQ